MPAKKAKQKSQKSNIHRKDYRRISLGKIGEEYSEKLLTEMGYKIVDKNYKIKLGEIDLIAIDKDTLVFVEVKTRTTRRFGRPEDAVDKKKIRKITNCAEVYMKTHRNLPKKVRIDVVSLLYENGCCTHSKIIKVYG